MRPIPDALVNALEAQAVGQSIGDPSAIAALETAVALYSRAFAAVRLSPAVPALSPSCLALIGRNLIRRGGEDFHRIYVRGGRVVLEPCGFAYPHGNGPDPMGWTYNVTLYGPTDSRHEWVPAASMLHTRYSVDPRARGSGRVRYIGRIEPERSPAFSKPYSARKRDRVWANLLPVPSDGGDGGDDDPLGAIESRSREPSRAPLPSSRQSQAAGGEGKAAAPMNDYKAQRIGAAVPDSSVSLRSDTASVCFPACGVPVSLATDADGTSQREAWRRFVMGSVEPLLEMVGQEIEAKLETRVSFDLSRLWAHDLAGRASSFKAMVTGGMAIERAAALSGLLQEGV